MCPAPHWSPGVTSQLPVENFQLNVLNQWHRKRLTFSWYVVGYHINPQSCRIPEPHPTSSSQQPTAEREVPAIRSKSWTERARFVHLSVSNVPDLVSAVGAGAVSRPLALCIGVVSLVNAVATNKWSLTLACKARAQVEANTIQNCSAPD